MLTQTDFEQKLIAAITDPEIVSRYAAGDPLVVQQVRANAAYFALLAKEIEVATIEPFIKTRDRSIIADATNKGILPLATPCRATLEIINNSTNSITLSQGRLIEDHSGGRIWRLLSSATVAANSTGTVSVEQSQFKDITHTIVSSESFYRFKIDLDDDMHLAYATVADASAPTVFYDLMPRWMNAAAGQKAFNLTTNSFRDIYIEFGDSERAGESVANGQTFNVSVLQTYGEVDTARLKDASLLEVLTTDEQYVSVRFQENGITQYGTNPLNVSQLRVLASYPALYDENAVFLGNFDFLVRKKFMQNADFISVWNEAVNEAHYGANYLKINRLNIAITPKTGVDATTLNNQIKAAIAQADSLFLNHVDVIAVVQKPFKLTITGRLAATHDLDAVLTQIRQLLIGQYGKGTLSASRWLINGFNTLEMATLIRQNIAAFQDNISDFSLNVDATSKLNKPHEWVFMDNANLTINLERTADSTGALWTII